MLRAFLSIAVGLLAAACGGDGEPIILGLAGPFSQPRGVAMERAARLAVGEINSRGGVRGRSLELLVLDDSARPDAALRVAEELYDTREVVAVVGHLTSGTTLAAAGIYNDGSHPVVSISPSASAPAVTAAGRFTFRICPTDEAHGTHLALWARAELSAERAVVLYQNEAYGRGVRATFSRQFGAGGIVAEEYPYVAETADFEPYIAHARRVARADVIMIAGARREGEGILRALRAADGQLPVVAADGLSGIEAEGALAEGVYISSAWLPDQAGDASRRFVEAYRRAYGGDLPDHRGAGAYDIVYLLAGAIEAVGADRDRIRDYVSRVGRGVPAFDGVTGRTVFDQQGDVVGKAVVIGVVRGGRLVTAEAQ